MEHLFYYYLIVIKVLAFSLMGIDKSKAKRHLWRIPEKTLFLSALLGGGAGMPMILIAEVAIYLYFIR